jgi:hypothetical protein
MGEDSGDDGSEQSLWGLFVAILIVIFWLGIPAVILSGLWLAAFVGLEHFTAIDIPAVTVSVIAALGGPPTVGGVPTILGVAGGLVSTAVWFARYGFGNSESAEKFGDQHREERRFEF